MFTNTLVLIGNPARGASCSNSDADAARLDSAGRTAESWPVYHAVYDQGTGAIYAAPRASGTARPSGAAPISARPGTHSSEGIAYDADGGRKISKVSTLAATHGRVLVGVEAPGIFESSDGGADLVAAVDARRTAGQRGLGRPGEPAARPSRHLRAHVRPRRRRALLGDRAGRRPVRDARRRRRRGRRATAACAPTGRASTRRSASACTSSSARRRRDRMYQQNHVGMHRSDDGGAIVDRDHRGPADRVRLRRRDAPARPRHVLRHPARPGPRPDDARRPGGRLAHARRGLELAARSTRACRRRTRTSACCARRWRSTRTTRPASTSGRAPARSSRAPTRATAGSEIASYLPGISSVEVAVLD